MIYTVFNITYGVMIAIGTVLMGYIVVECIRELMEWFEGEE